MKKITLLSTLFLLGIYINTFAITTLTITSLPDPILRGNTFNVTYSLTTDLTGTNNWTITPTCSACTAGPTYITPASNMQSTNDGMLTITWVVSFTATAIEATLDITLSATATGPEVVTFTGDLTSTLPITLSSFTGKRVGSTIELRWVTESETDNAYMEVERSRDGIKFGKIGEKKASGNGNSKVQQTYAFTDYEPLLGVNYYRLHQFDKDGKDEYHNIIAVLFTDGKGEGIQVFPTLVANQLNIAWDKETRTDGEVFISNATGQLLLRQAIGAGTQQHNIELPTLPADTYFVTIQTDRTVQTARFVKQ